MVVPVPSDERSREALIGNEGLVPGRRSCCGAAIASSQGFVGERLGADEVYSEMTAAGGGSRGVSSYDYM